MLFRSGDRQGLGLGAAAKCCQANTDAARQDQGRAWLVVAGGAGWGAGAFIEGEGG